MDPEPRRRENSETLRTDFARQRRSLIAVSVAHALFLGAGVSLTEVNLLGTKLELTNPRVVPLGLWLFLTYFLLRYYQHFSDLNDKGPSTAFSDELGRMLARRGRESFEKSFPKQYMPEQALTNPVFRYDMVASNGDPKGKWTVAVRGTMTAQAGETRTVTTFFPDTTIALRVSLEDRVRAWMWVAANTRYFTEYVLPILLAALPPIMVALGSAPF